MVESLSKYLPATAQGTPLALDPKTLRHKAPVKAVTSFDDLLLALSTEVDFKTGESLFASEQVEMLEQEH